MKVDEGVALSRFTTIGTGGPATAFARPETVEALEEALAWARERQLAVATIGLGSNRRPTPRNSASTRSASERSTPASSSVASATAAFLRLCSPGTASSSATGSSSGPRTTAGIPASQRSKSSSNSSSDAKVAWWSSSTLVTAAIFGRSSSSDRSDSSPSATSQPLPERAFPPS